MSWIVEMIDAGCDCCSFVPVGQFETKAEAIKFAAGDKNLFVYEEDDYEEDDYEEGEQK